MHSSGVQFGLTQGLLQLYGEEVLLSDQLLETLSLEAQRHLDRGGPPIQGNFLVDITVRAAQNALDRRHTGDGQQLTPFFMGLNRTMYYTLCRMAERAGLAHKEPRRLLTNPDFWNEFLEQAVDVQIRPARSVAKMQKALFKICQQIVNERYVQNDPANTRHAGLAALFMFNFWNATGILPITQAMILESDI